MTATLHISRPDPAIVLIEIDSPPVNTLGHSLRERFDAELDLIEADMAIRCVILTGRGSSFCAGDDLREAVQRGQSAIDSLTLFGRIIERIEALRVPVIAAVNGPAVGGGLELALGCDIRIASERAAFVGAGVNVGLMASVHRLPRVVGIGAAKSILLTGTKTDASRAYAIGLVSEIHPHDELPAAALALARRIASRAPLSVEATKAMTGRAFDLTPDEAQEQSRAILAELSQTADHRAGVAAFVARVDPVFERR